MGRKKGEFLPLPIFILLLFFFVFVVILSFPVQMFMVDRILQAVALHIIRSICFCCCFLVLRSGIEFEYWVSQVVVPRVLMMMMMTARAWDDDIDDDDGMGYWLLFQQSIMFLVLTPAVAPDPCILFVHSIEGKCSLYNMRRCEKSMLYFVYFLNMPKQSSTAIQLSRLRAKWLKTMWIGDVKKWKGKLPTNSNINKVLFKKIKRK